MAYERLEDWLDKNVDLGPIYTEEELIREILRIYEAEEAAKKNAGGIKRFADGKLWKQSTIGIFNKHLEQQQEEAMKEYKEQKTREIREASTLEELQLLREELKSTERLPDNIRHGIKAPISSGIKTALTGEITSMERQISSDLYNEIRSAGSIDELLAIDVPEPDDQSSYLKSVLRTKYNELAEKELKK